MVEIMTKKFDKDFCLNLGCEPLGYFAKMNSTLGSVVPLAMFILYFSVFFQIFDKWCGSHIGQCPCVKTCVKYKSKYQ